MTEQRHPGEVFEAYAHLNERERHVMLGIACHYARGTAYGEPLDLLHEALARTADGRRRWAQSVDFGAHMALTMRSIADSDRKLHGNLRASGVAFEELMEWAADSIGSHPSAEDDYSKAQEMSAFKNAVARAKFHWERHDDREASNVLDAILADLDDGEIAERLGVARSAVACAKKRVLRKLGHYARL